jgi:rare lipoprotein A
MNSSRRRRAADLIVLASVAFALAACGSPSGSRSVHVKKRSSEYFSEAEYGVKASPRVTSKRTRLPRGGGRDQVGRPYKVKGKWYYPKEDRNYRKVGAASWYGDAFHGRLTANGEIYDMTHLTAAHPTMPLPSYARVTNTKNGASVIVRVNDRGPYANGRIIDLSKRAAELLDYTHAGVAKVKVEYVGRAPLDGQDDRYLMASYRPGKDMDADPLSDGLPEGVMIAMNGPTPSGAIGGGAVAFGGIVANRAAPVAAGTVAPTYAAIEPVGMGGALLPDFGPMVPERPLEGFFLGETQVAMVTSYADERVKRAGAAFAAFDRAAARMSADELAAAWTSRNGQPGREYVAAGAFASETEAGLVAKALAGFGRTEIEMSVEGGRTWYELNVRPDGRAAIDAILEAAWRNGAPDALTVRE